MAPQLQMDVCRRILQRLEDRDWVVGGSEGAAAKLGVKRTTLISMMERFGI